MEEYFWHNSSPESAKLIVDLKAFGKFGTLIDKRRHNSGPESVKLIVDFAKI